MPNIRHTFKLTQVLEILPNHGWAAGRPPELDPTEIPRHTGDVTNEITALQEFIQYIDIDGMRENICLRNKHIYCPNSWPHGRFYPDNDVTSLERLF